MECQPEQPSEHDALYVASLKHLAIVLDAISTEIGTSPDVLTAAGVVLPRRGDCAESLMMWRTLLENLHTIATRSEEVTRAAMCCATIVIQQVNKAGLANTLFPQAGPIN